MALEDILNCTSKQQQEQQKRSLMNKPQPEAFKCQRCDSSNKGTALEDVLDCPSKQLQEQQKRSLVNKPQEALKCPRCDSSNTKFSFYNNYSRSQPRYFCKACRRFWTKGGSLRNVPVGGGCRKYYRRISSCSASSKAKSSPSSSISCHHRDNPYQIYLYTNSIINPLLAFPTYDLSIALGRLHKQQPTWQLGFDHEHHQPSYGNPNSIIRNIINSSNANNTDPGFIDVPRNGYLGHEHPLNCINTRGNTSSIIGNCINSSNSNTTNPGYIYAPKSGFLEPSSGLHNPSIGYNGIGMTDHQQHLQQVERQSSNGGGSINGNCHEEDDHCREQVVLQYKYEEIDLPCTVSSTITTSTKPEILNDSVTKVLWNLPWHGQFSGGEQGNNNIYNNHHKKMGSVINNSTSGGAGRD
ncbi:hypothetical protein MKW94_006928 [Papaver nudicaule]|uniref:Dof zinc finger protein n=1 Tax=Papaver nudicaule TaxID=74823 RepID=A0AA41VQE3_PAPNU|nr:hypothetical protein [Papaver nudicaule]